jgi:hypothetical protein
MGELRQRQPRERNRAYLNFIRQQRCCVCGDNTTVEAAHLRTGSVNHGKEAAGMAQKSSDIWALPLCGRHHREQHSMGEMQFWTSHGINDPFALAMHYHARPR